MAKKKLNTSTKSSADGINDKRKVEIIGVIIIAISVLLGLSILSYTPADYQYAKNISFMDLFNPDATQRLIQNWLGPVGAYISHFVVYSLFGYTSFIISVLLAYQGWHIFRQRDYKELGWISILSVWSVILLSSIIGWLNTNASFPEDSVWEEQQASLFRESSKILPIRVYFHPGGSGYNNSSFVVGQRPSKNH